MHSKTTISLPYTKQKFAHRGILLLSNIDPDLDKNPAGIFSQNNMCPGSISVSGALSQLIKLNTISFVLLPDKKNS